MTITAKQHEALKRTKELLDQALGDLEIGFQDFGADFKECWQMTTLGEIARELEDLFLECDCHDHDPFHMIGGAVESFVNARMRR